MTYEQILPLPSDQPWLPLDVRMMAEDPIMYAFLSAIE